MAKLLIDEPPLQYLPSLGRALGDAIQAIILQQLHYRLGQSTKVHAGHKWVYNSYDGWGDEFGMKGTLVRRKLEKLRERGLIVSIQNPHHAWDNILWWRIDEVKYAAFELEHDIKVSKPTRSGSQARSSGSQARSERPTGQVDLAHRTDRNGSQDSAIPKDDIQETTTTIRPAETTPLDAEAPGQTRDKFGGVFERKFEAKTGKTWA